MLMVFVIVWFGFWGVLVLFFDCSYFPVVATDYHYPSDHFVFPYTGAIAYQCISDCIVYPATGAIFYQRPSDCIRTQSLAQPFTNDLRLTLKTQAAASANNHLSDYYKINNLYDYMAKQIKVRLSRAFFHEFIHCFNFHLNYSTLC